MFSLNLFEIPIIDLYKYVGIVINTKRCDVALKIGQMKKLYANTNMLLRKFSKCLPDYAYNMHYE